MKIIINTEVPDQTYFTLTDVEPAASGNALTITHGNGTHRSWGKPGVDSTVVLNTATITAVHVGFHHKHRGGQGWFYFLKGERRTWAQLDEKRQKQVLAAASKAPGWAKAPGKLKSERAAVAAEKMTGYKLVGFAEGELVSLYDGSVYTLGVKRSQAARSNHHGGFYAYADLELATGLLDSKLAWKYERLAVVEVALSGKIIHYDNGKLAATHITPLRIVERFDHDAHVYTEVNHV